MGLRMPSEAARRFYESHPEAHADIERAIEIDRRKRAGERPVEVTVRFKCLPSDLEGLKLALRSLPISDRTIRVSDASAREGDGDGASGNPEVGAAAEQQRLL